jgi:Arc/MetJ-type ribon-helix-helix transcriptional regulator
MPKRRRGGYHGGSTVIRASVGLSREKTQKHNTKVQRERERLAAEQAAFEQNQTPTLIKADSPEGRKQLLKHIIDQERAKRRAERKARRRLDTK